MNIRAFIIFLNLTAAATAAWGQTAQPIPQAPKAAAIMPHGNAAPGYFPALPPSHKCVPNQVKGIWRLTQVYENPVGQTATQFSAQPYQFLQFRPDNIYKEYSTSYPPGNPQMVRQKINAVQPAVLSQYLVHQSGFIFIYKNSVAIDTQACFIVASNTDPFKVGELLLMPPEGHSSTRLVRVYQRLGATPPGPNGRKQNARRRRQPGQ